jgi:uncharacterized membrane protein YeiH
VTAEQIDRDLILALSLAGTFVFGLSGGLAAVRAQLDIVGLVALAAVVGLAGGITRDLLIGVPPAAFRDWIYLVVAGGAGVVTFFAHPRLARLEREIEVLDAAGLSLFCVTGATTALNDGVAAVPAVVVGVITAVGGGLLRDVLVGRVPMVFHEDLYAIPALVGATIVTVAYELGGTGPAFAIAGALVCLAIRLAGMRYGVRAPRPHRRREDGEASLPGPNDAGLNSGEVEPDPESRRGDSNPRPLHYE